MERLSGHRRSEKLWPAISGAMLAGLVLGGANSLSNVFGSPYSPHALRPYEGVFPLEVLGAVLGYPWTWALLAFAVGWWSSRAWLAPAMGVLALLVAVVTYYVSDFNFGLNDELGTYEIAYWSLVSLVAGLVCGPLGKLARCRRWWGLLPGLAAPAVVALTSWPAGSDHIRPWPQRVAWTVAAVLMIAITTRWVLDRIASR